jgi:esterase/lipase superfamily enzyme
MRPKHSWMFISFAFLMVIGYLDSALAQSAARLGEARVNLASGRAFVSLSGGSIGSIQLESLDQAVSITSATLTFADGRTQSISGVSLSPRTRSGNLSVGTPGVPRSLLLTFAPKAGATRIAVYGVAAAAPPPPSAETSDASTSTKRRAFRSMKGGNSDITGRAETTSPANEPRGGAAPPDAAAQAKRVADERVREEQMKRAAAAAKAPPASAPSSAPSAIPPIVASAPVARGVSIADPCKERAICTPVPVFFGTDRKQVSNPDRIDFGADRDRKMQLGQAIVTVPRVKRQSGKVLRPTLFERLVLRIPESGDPARHFTIPRNGISLMSESEFLNAVRAHRENAGTFKDHAFVFVHGYNTAFDSALYRTAQIAFDLSDVAGSEADRVPFGTAFLYSWPSGGGTVDYVYDHGSARGAEEHFQKFLDLVIAKSGAKQIHLIAHSLGNSLLLNVLKNYRLPPSAGASINQIILAAPAIDAEEFGFIAEKIKSLATGGVTLYASSKDRALAAASRFNRGRPMAGGVPEGGPIIVKGIDSIDVSAIPTDSFWGHDLYADRRELLEDIWRLVSKGVRPPDTRNTHYKVQGPVGNVFWRYAE